MKYFAIGFGWTGIGIVIGLMIAGDMAEKKEDKAIASGWISLGQRPFKLIEVKP